MSVVLENQTEAAVAAASTTTPMTSAEIVLDCPVYTNRSDQIIRDTVFWVEGVGLSTFSVIGILGNIFSCIVFSRAKMRNAFNLLLVALAVFDTVYNFASLLETMRKSFGLASNAQLLLYPVILYPMQWISLTGSEFMIVAIAFERYVSVHHPIDYNLAMNDPREIRKRLLKYFVPVLLISIGFNLPKFFETEAFIIPVSASDGNETKTESADYVVRLNVTEMRIHPIYSTWANWSQLFVLGVIPVCLLIYFNFKIYRDVKERERRRRPQQQQQQQVHQPLQALSPSPASSLQQAPLGVITSSAPPPQPAAPTATTRPLSNWQPERREMAAEAASASDANSNDSNKFVPLNNAAAGGGEAQVLPEKSGTFPAPPTTATEALEISHLTSSVHRRQPEPGEQQRRRDSVAGRGRYLRLLRRLSSGVASKYSVVFRDSSSRDGATNTGSEADGDASNQSNNGSAARGVVGGSRMSNAKRRRVEDRMAILFMGIVFVNLVCHFPRILLNFYEMMVIEKAMACSEAGQRAFAVWAQVVASVNNFLLVFNSSVNIVIYSFFNAQFRNAASELLRPAINWALGLCGKKYGRSSGATVKTAAGGSGRSAIVAADAGSGGGFSVTMAPTQKGGVI